MITSFVFPQSCCCCSLIVVTYHPFVVHWQSFRRSLRATNTLQLHAKESDSGLVIRLTIACTCKKGCPITRCKWSAAAGTLMAPSAETEQKPRASVTSLLLGRPRTNSNIFQSCTELESGASGRIYGGKLGRMCGGRAAPVGLRSEGKRP